MMTVREFHAELTRRIVENPGISDYEMVWEDEYGWTPLTFANNNVIIDTEGKRLVFC